MANKYLFRSTAGSMLSKSDTINKEGAPAYAFSPKAMLAQYAATGCLNGTFYAAGDEQLTTVLDLAGRVDAGYVAKTAIYARENGLMKDMPALLTAVLATRAPELLPQVFARTMDNARMLRNFVQIIRSGVTGRKSLGSLPKKLVQKWLEARSDEALFCDFVGNDPSIADIIKMTHPVPSNAVRAALYGYIIGRDCPDCVLPEIARRYEAFKAGQSNDVPDVPFQMLTSLELGAKEWSAIARNARWQMTRMNLNTFARHGVFEDADMTELIARRIADPAAIAKARAFPYQLMAAYFNLDTAIPPVIRNALQDAMEIATSNVPRIQGKIYICPDVSGSMAGAAITGYRKGATSTIRCIDVAALFTAALLRQNPAAQVIPFAEDVVDVRLNARDSIMTNASHLAAAGGGGTNISAPLARLNAQKEQGSLVIYISDNQSWVDARNDREATQLMREWNIFKQRNPDARLICIDIQPYGETQAADREDILNVGGFSDSVFEVVKAFADGKQTSDYWVDVIEKINL
jgi:60 kDa SS-A/Ro ribonucleoprotein